MGTFATCQKCGGKAKVSKGIVNFHNIQVKPNQPEFETKLVDCLKCTACGHSWIP